jgi:hypothetical protein
MGSVLGNFVRLSKYFQRLEAQIIFSHFKNSAVLTPTA